MLGADLGRYRLEAGQLTLYADRRHAPDLTPVAEMAVRLPGEYLWVLPLSE